MYAALLFAVIAVLDELICMWILNLMGLNTQVLMEQGNERAIYLIFATIIHLSIILSVARAFTKRQDALTWKQLIPLLLCQLFSIYICYVLYLWSISMTEVTGQLILLILGIFYINIIVIVFVEVMKENAEAQRRQALAEQQYDMQLKYYKQIWQEQDETRALWHDINKYMTAMKTMVTVGNESAAEQVMNEAQNTFAKVKAAVDVDNPTVSAILNHNLQHANCAGIPVDMDVWIPPDCNVSAVDLSIIVGNTFDNAIEACGAVEPTEQHISFCLKKKNNLLLYEITNPYNQKTPVKKLGKYHGYGLKNVKKCAEKHHGSMENEAKDGIYKVSIRLNCE